MKVQRRRFVLSEIVFLVTIVVAVFFTYINYKYLQLNSTIEPLKKFKIPIINDYNNACFRARKDSVPKIRYGELNYPFINLGFPKIGSSSIHSFFGCAGYRSLHYRCNRSTKCAECIKRSVQEGLQPLYYCTMAEVYSQIDDGREYFPQINHLEEIVKQYPNATLLLTFRNMESWYASLSKWTRNGTRMDQELMISDIPGLPYGMGRNAAEFSTWFCNHIERVRGVVERNPSLTLVEIDLEDEDGTRQQMSDIFNVDASCWVRANANLDLHPELKSENIIATSDIQSKWFLLGSRMIKGKDGSKRKRNYHGQQFLNYP